jgi:Flp pilus assembly protein TadG
MVSRASCKVGKNRRGVAVAEFAIILPIVVFLFLIAVDYCRLFYYSQIVTNCARNGAIYASDTFSAWHAIYPDLTTAAKDDAPPSIQSDLTVTSTTGSDSLGNYVDVTVSYPFTTLTSYPGIPQLITITRTVRTRMAPAAPN